MKVEVQKLKSGDKVVNFGEVKTVENIGVNVVKVTFDNSVAYAPEHENGFTFQFPPHKLITIHK